MNEPSHNKQLPILDEAVVARELKDLTKLLERPGPTQGVLDKWVVASPERAGIFHDTFWGSIRWPKSLGRSSGANLWQGFSIALRNHFTIRSVIAGGGEVDREGYMQMAAPYLWDAADDSEHYRVNYSGTYARLNLNTDRNEVAVTIAGSWTNPSRFGAHFLLPSPLGRAFGSFDGQPIVLDETTVELHVLQPVPVWSVEL